MPLIDLTFLNSFTGGNREKVSKYVNLFLQFTPQIIDTMEKNLGEKNYPALRTSAHSLKPQITYMGIKSAEDLIKTIEANAGDQKNVEQIPQQMEELKSILNSAIPELKQAVENS